MVCWPASVSATLEEVRKGNVPRPLGAMGDWVTGRETSEKTLPVPSRIITP